jgi:LuxR family maltose regulon positive regulatory protein
MKSNLLGTKLHRPSLPTKQVHRHHLIRLLNEGLDEGRYLTLVSAPAGFGKTTCICEWLESLVQPAAWVSLDKSDNDPVRFFRYFMAALQQLAPDVGKDLNGVLAAGELPAVDVIATHLINDAMEINRQILLILDDFHVIQESTILQVIEQLLSNQPNPLHLVLIAREDPLLALARLRANNRMTEIRANDLRFNQQETADFLNERLGLALSAEDLSLLDKKTEGWIVGLQLAGLSMRNIPSPTQFIINLKGNHRFILNYLIEEVLHQQLPEIQDFMLQTSVLDRMNGDLCNAITGRTDASQLLEQLYQANLFLISLDEEQIWYRYHHLFADLLRSLQKQLPGEQVSECHLRASRWYEQAGMPGEAIEHALEAQNYPLAVALLEKYAMSILTQGYAKTLEEWMQSIPEGYQSKNPKANLAFAWMHLLRGSYGKIGPYLEKIETVLANLDQISVGEDDINRLLVMEWYAFQSNFLNVMGKPDESADYARRALQQIPADDHYLLGQAYLGLGGSYRLKGDYPNLIAAYQKALHHSGLSGNILGEMLALAAIMLTSIQYGRLRFAMDTATPIIERVEKSGSIPPPIMGTVYGSVGLVYFEWNQLERAYHYFHQSTHLSGLVGHNAGLLYSSVIMSQYYMAAGNRRAAAHSIQEATRLLESGVPAWLRPEVAAQQVRIFLLQDDLAAAKAVMEHFETQTNQLPFASHGLLKLSKLRCLHHQFTNSNDPDIRNEAVALADQLIADAYQEGRTGTIIQALLLRAQMLPGSKSLQDALQTVELAKPEGYIRIFVDEGPRVAQLLKQIAHVTPHRNYVRTLLDAFGDLSPDVEVSPPAHGLIEALTDRELEVLRLMSKGLKYEEIAEALVITLNTVRFHVKQIYRKMNVNNRTGAIEIARQLDLL